MLFHCDFTSLLSLFVSEFPVTSHCGMWDFLKWDVFQPDTITISHFHSSNNVEHPNDNQHQRCVNNLSQAVRDEDCLKMSFGQKFLELIKMIQHSPYFLMFIKDVCIATNNDTCSLDNDFSLFEICLTFFLNLFSTNHKTRTAGLIPRRMKEILDCLNSPVP